MFQLQQEGRILLGLKNHVVPKIGESVRVLNLANSQALTSGVVSVSVIITARKRSLGQGNVFTRVCHSVHREGLASQRHHRSHDQGGLHLGGGSASRVELDRPPPLGLHMGGWADPPKIHGILWDMVNKWAVCILLECFLVTTVQPVL